MRLETDGDGGPQLGAADVDIYCLGIIVSPLSQTQDQGPGLQVQVTRSRLWHLVMVSLGPGLADYPEQVTIQLYNVFVSTLTVNISYISLMML